MTKKQEALNKAKESWKKVVEWWKELWKWSIQVVWWTAWAVVCTLVSWYEKWAYVVSKNGEKAEWIKESERRRRAYITNEHNRKSKEYIKTAWKLGKTAIKWAWKALKWWAKTLWYGAKVGYHMIDAWDKAIGEKIEKKQLEKWKKTWKVVNFFRDNILKLLIAASAAWYGWYKAIDGMLDKNEDKIEIVEDLNEREKFVKEFFNSPDVLKDLKSSGKEWEDKWEGRYLWKDDAWNNMKDGFWFAERKKVIEWMCRMIESWDLEMVLNKADEAWVPRQCIFLALAESWWQAGADSWVAWWYWQFTKPTGKLFWLVDGDWNDYRADPEISTDAAMRHLKDNYKIVCNYARQLWYKLSESDKWIFAFHMYNWSPKLVRKWMVACKWNANLYPEKQLNWENRNYVPRILWIQNALQQIFKEHWYDVSKIKSVHLNENVVKTEADLMFEDYIKKEWSLTDIEKFNRLDKVELKYKQEYESSVITEKYYKWAIRVIWEFKQAVRKEDEEEE